MHATQWGLACFFAFLMFSCCLLEVVIGWKKPDFKEGRWITLMIAQLIAGGGIYAYCMLRLALLTEG